MRRSVWPRCLGRLGAASLSLSLCTLACGSEGHSEDPSDEASTTVASAIIEPPAPPDVPEAFEPPGITSCEELTGAADASMEDAYAIALICPEVTLSPSQQRAALMRAGSLAEIRALIPRLDPESEWAFLARLLALELPATAFEGRLDPAKARVTPIDDAVLAKTVHASTLR